MTDPPASATAPRVRGTQAGRQRRVWRVVVLLTPIVGVLVAWSLLWDHTDFLPSPGSTLTTAREVLRKPGAYIDLLATARRLVLGLSMGFTTAVFVSLVMHRSAWWRGFFAPYVFATISLPAMATALFALMVFGLSEVGIYAAVGITIFPFAVVGMLEGLDNLDTRLGQMASVYRFSWGQYVRHVALPETAPFLFATLRNVHALAWKVVVLAEVFSQQTGIGHQYVLAYSFFELQRLLVWGSLFITMVVGVEYGILRPLERVSSRWRR